MLSSRWTSLFLGAGLLAGCVEDPTTGSVTSEVQAGTTTYDFPGTGYLFNQSNHEACSAALIGERTVLTAAHCIVKDPTSGELDLARASDIAFYPVADATPFNATSFQATRLVGHPEFAGGAHDDLAIVILSRTPSDSLTRLPIATRAPVVGDEVSIIGYGWPHDGKRQITTNTIAKLATTTLEYDGDGNICDGDSGGPSVIERDGAQVVAGVHTGRIGDCGERAFDERVDAYAAWIQEAAEGDVVVEEAAPSDDAPTDDSPADDPGSIDATDDGAAGCTAGHGGSGGLAVLLAALVSLRRRRP